MLSHWTLLATPMETSTLRSLFESIQDGGWMMVPLGMCSVLAMGFFFERLVALRAGRLFPRRLEKELAKRLEKDGPVETARWCAEGKSPAARIFAAGLRRWYGPRMELEKAVEDAGSREIAMLSGNLRPLVVVSSIAPLMGLLGTVIGMIRAFSVIATGAGIGKPEKLADGISEALVTTAAGLIVAIPTQVAYFYLRARIDRFTRRVETVFHDVLCRALDEEEATRGSERSVA